MHPILRLTIRIALIIFVIFIASKPYNWFCSSSGKCGGFYLSDLFVKDEVGEEFDVVFEVNNYNSNIDFGADQRVIQTVFNRKNTALFYVKNNSEKTLTIRPKFDVVPAAVKDYVITRNCLCSKEVTLKPGQAEMLAMDFRIDSDAIKKAGFDPYGSQIVKSVVITYTVPEAK